MTSKKVGPNFWEGPGFSFFSKNYKDIKTVEKLCRPQSGHETPAFDSTTRDISLTQHLSTYQGRFLYTRFSLFDYNVTIVDIL